MNANDNILDLRVVLVTGAIRSKLEGNSIW